MEAKTVKELKDELKHLDKLALIETVLRLSKFKKENKELLSYLLFDSERESAYIEEVKKEIDEGFKTMNTATGYLIKKTARKILRLTKKYIRYSGKKETEIELILHYCRKLIALEAATKKSLVLENIYTRELTRMKKLILGLHEDLQYDYEREVCEIEAAYLNS